jgi:hypothetical protein
VTSIVYTCALIAAGFFLLRPDTIVTQMGIGLLAVGSGMALFAMMCLGKASTYAVAPSVSRARRGRKRIQAPSTPRTARRSA